MEFSAVTAGGDAPTKRVYHSCSVVGTALFIFGGMGEDKCILNTIYRYDIEIKSWSKIDSQLPSSYKQTSHVSTRFRGNPCTAPSLSHHTATVVDDRYIIVIGGWNGKKRVAEIYCFDTTDATWLRVTESGDVPVGLSSHTATLVSSKEILIVGREGGVRTQRRFSGAFYLNIETGHYTEAPYHTASRSGHISNLIHVRHSKEFYLLVFGGRNSGGYEVLGRWNHKEKYQQGVSISKAESLLGYCTPCDEPEGRQHCQSIEICNRYLMFYAGEKWSGVRENVTNETYLLDTHQMSWHSVPVSQDIPKLVGHTMCAAGDRIFVFGGQFQNKPCNTLWHVDFV